MTASSDGRLVILTGPSGMGKTPLVAALRRFHAELAARLQPVVLFNSRAPRPGEEDGRDYHFRPREQVEALRDDDRYAVIEVRADLQALDLQNLRELLEHGDALFEGSPQTARTLLSHPGLSGVNRLSIFVSPLSADEIRELRDRPQLDLRDFVTRVMRRKLLRRAQRQNPVLGLPALQDIEKRAASAFDELRVALACDHVLPNHDGEDSDHWDAFGHPIGDARRTLLAVADLLRGQVPPAAEIWDDDLLRS